MINGPNRSPDPWLHVTDRLIFRRLAADTRKVNLTQKIGADAPEADEEHARKLLRAMGFDLGAIHAGDEEQVQAISCDLDRRDPGWLYTNTKSAATWVEADYEEWRKHSQTFCFLCSSYGRRFSGPSAPVPGPFRSSQVMMPRRQLIGVAGRT